MEVKLDCIKLRKEGKSYREIARILTVPLSTVFLWTEKIKLSREQINENKQKSLDSLQQSRQFAQKVKREKYLHRNELNRKIGFSMIDKINNQNINGIIAALYWGEGFKKDRRLGLANSDPRLIKLFVYWLVNITKVPREQIRLRVGINVLFSDRIEVITNYWSKQTGISLDQFQKPFYQNTKIKRVYPDTTKYYGVLRVRANGQNDIFQKLLGMVERLRVEGEGLEI